MQGKFLSLSELSSLYGISNKTLKRRITIIEKSTKNKKNTWKIK